MVKYVAKRVAYMFFVLFVVTTITFFLMHNIPGDPLTALVQKLPEQTKANYYAKYGLDKPVYEQFLLFLKGIFTEGSLGESIRYPGRMVLDVIKKYAACSGQIGVAAVAIGFVLGTMFGVISALKKNKLPDKILSLIAILGVSLPVFVVASVLQYIFTLKIPILPTMGWGEPKHMVLPIICMSLSPLATYTRYMRSSVLDVVNQDYITMAEAKGMSFGMIVRRHILRNSILPSLTILGPNIADVFTGSFIIESIFSIPGLGSYYITSVTDRDFPMIIGSTMFYTGIYILSLLIVDILYVIIDPRIRLSETK
ncbi:MAG: ABC transporter permease [Eubacteriales bacterium]|nr:ABC transporter permease [Eubacteriales bacterium]